ncbi:MAG: hypothetical protein JXL82_04790 [Candidatus Omnitrophica bacterium]|nr:hypothetical protein [Candidatus Omnitrophota bacterium]
MVSKNLMANMMAGNGEDTNKYNENENTRQKKQQTVHRYSTPLFNMVAIINVTTNSIRPIEKILSRNSSPEINWPMTKAVKTNFAISYKALANSLRCNLSRLIIILNITNKLTFVKEKIAEGEVVGLAG